MPESLVVRSDGPTYVPRLSGETVSVTNESADTTVYYGSSTAVTSASNDGSVGPGSLVALSGGKWFISGNFPGLLYGQARLYVDERDNLPDLGTKPTLAVTPGSTATVGTSPVTLFAANASRVLAGFTVNHSTAIVSVSRGATAVSGQGELVYPGESWKTGDYAGAVQVISDTASTPVAFFEV